MAANLRFRLLGSFEVTRGSTPIEVTSNKLRVVLATLLLAANRTVSVNALVERLWGSTPPDGARATLQVHVMRLRRTLGDDHPIRTTAGGYRIVVEPSNVDVARFHSLLHQSRAASDPISEADLLAEALSLWRGPALLGVESDALHEAEVPLLVEERLRAVERRAEIALSSGRHAEVIGELTALVHEHPLRERSWASLIALLHRSGRRADALDAYQRMYRRFRDELGIGPGDQIRQLHGAILAAEPDADHAEPSRERRSTDPVVPPAQLPAVLGTFVGRADEHARLRRHLSGAAHGAQVVVISGAPGVGKTALALRAAHSVRELFPDGQLYVDLQGHSTDDPVPPAAVLERFLRASGVPAAAVPDDPQDKANLYRSVLAGQQVLVVLDNASSTRQVRALLPGGAGSAAVITSRNALRELAVSGAETMTLQPLSEPEAYELLADVAAQARAEPRAALDLVEACGRLPLALRIAGANLDANPHLPLHAYLAELRSRGISHLRVGESEEIAVRRAFDLSYEQLPVSVADLFGWLGVAPGSDFSVYAAAAIAGTDDMTAARRLDVLVAANLVQPAADRRYRIHDLLRSYAADRAADDPPGSAAAVTRLLDHYFHSARNAIAVLEPDRRPDPLPSPGTEVRPNRPTSEWAARSWLDAELPNLVAAALHTGAPEGSQRSFRLAELLRQHVSASGYCLDGITAWDASLLAAEQNVVAPAPTTLTTFVVDRYRKALSHRTDTDGPRTASSGGGDPAAGPLHDNHRGFSTFVAGRPDLALGWHRQALVAAQALGDRRGAVQAYNGLGMASWATGRLTAAIHAHERAARMSDEHQDAHVRGFSLLWLGVARAASGDYVQAAADVEAGIRIGVAVDEPKHQIMGQVVRADILTRTGRPDAAIGELLEARRRAEELDFRPGMPGLLVHLAEARRATGDPSAALRDVRLAHSLAGDAGVRSWEIPALIELGRCQLALDQPVQAEESLRRALADARVGRMRLAEADALFAYGLAAVRLGDDVGAYRYWRQARRIHKGIGTPGAAHVGRQRAVADTLTLLPPLRLSS
ncbi:AfsR/SARP family transcriptional regulator [Pseudonocardia sp. TRM90224]|uniref:AfsR/SARP family transcriptional regulator n=1 Tax=Pseudonocardia sp. TRM90224 TaxID=2812678 RepID=UPI001E36C871|nr:BTAD domain-containing putative transcriptional regulator [Pseudonocardia sp. TRM90224]